MGYSIGLFLERAKAKESRVSVRLYTRGKGVRKHRNERVGNVPNLVVNTKHWHKGGLSPKAPQDQQQRITAIRERINALQADLQRNPQYITAATVRRYLWPDTTDGWVKLFEAAAAQANANTAERYRYSLLSFQRFCKKEQPSQDLYVKWGQWLPRKYEATTVNSYIGAVRSCFDTVGQSVTRKGLRLKEPKRKGGIALSAAELSAIYALDLKVGSSLGRHRDALICACITSLRSCDWHFFSTEWIGREVVNKKTSVSTPIPKHPVIIELIRRNGGAINTAKNPNNQLRRIGKLASEACPSLLSMVTYRKKNVTRWEALVSHVGRRTYVSHGRSHRVDPAELLRFTGHVSFKQLEHYNAGSMTAEEQANTDADIAARVIPVEVFTPSKLSVVNE